MPICVGVQVAVQSGLLDKGLGAQVALVWTLACMDAQVVDQVALPHEGLAAMAALEGTLARVRAYVVLEMARVRCLVATLLAAKKPTIW